MDNGEGMEADKQVLILRARVAELEDAMRAQKKGLINLLTIMKEYGGIFLTAYNNAMGKADAERAAADLVAKHFPKGNPSDG
jgi:hypothetical protein